MSRAASFQLCLSILIVNVSAGWGDNGVLEKGFALYYRPLAKNA